MNTYNFFPWFSSPSALGCYLASKGSLCFDMPCSLMAFFFTCICNFSGSGSMALLHNMLMLHMLFRLIFWTPAFTLLSFWEDSRQPLNQFLQSILCRYCAAKLIFSVLGHSSPTVKPHWMEPSRCSSCLQVGRYIKKILSAPRPRCCVTQQSHDRAGSSPQPSPASSGTANDSVHFLHLEIKGFLSHSNFKRLLHKITSKSSLSRRWEIRDTSSEAEVKK